MNKLTGDKLNNTKETYCELKQKVYKEQTTQYIDTKMHNM